MYRLIFLSGQFKGKRLVVHQSSVTVGRDADCHVHLPDDEVSRKHAVLEERPDGVHIHDLDSMNRIILNGQEIRGAQLKNHDTIELGKTLIQFEEIQRNEASQQRVVGHVQTLTFAAVVLIILIEILFLSFLMLWRRDTIKGVEAPPPAEMTGVVERVAISNIPSAISEEESNTLEAAAARSAKLQTEQSALFAQGSTQAVSGQVTEQIQDLREDVDNLRQQMQEFSEESTTVEPPSPPPVAQPPPPPVETQQVVQVTPEQALKMKADQMMDEFQRELTKSNFLEADKVLERIQIMAPDYLNAYVERAKLSEKRGLLKKASEQWNEVMKRSAGSELYEQAMAERIRIARLEAQQAAVQTPPKPPSRKAPSVTAAPAVLQRRIRIMSTEQQKFQAGDEFEEMRLVRIALKPKIGERNIDTDEVRVVVSFFDRDVKSNDIVPTRAVTPKDALRLEGPWDTSDEKAVTAAYVLPKGFREKERTQNGQSRKYFGYRVQVYYEDVIQDEDAHPKTLLQEPVEPAPKI